MRSCCCCCRRRRVLQGRAAAGEYHTSVATPGPRFQQPSSFGKTGEATHCADQIRMEMEPEEERQEFVPSSSIGKTEGGRRGGNSGSSSAAAAKRRKLQQQQQQKVLLDDEQRCKRSDGKGWHCEHMRTEGSTYCDHHYYRKNKTPSKTKKAKNKSFSPRKLLLASNSSRLFSAAKSYDDEEKEDDRTSGEVLSGMVEDAIGSRMCHQYQRNDKAKVVYYNRCNHKRYCSPCIQAWYPLLLEKDVAAGCHFYNGNCNCKLLPASSRHIPGLKKRQLLISCENLSMDIWKKMDMFV